MARIGRNSVAAEQSGPVLDLSGPRLRRAFADLVTNAEATGGIERYVTALALKASLFDELLGPHAADLTETEFLDLAAFITPVRRKIGPWLGENGFARLHARILRLVQDQSHVDDRLAGFCAAFPQDKAHRWVRDLGAEVLHFTAPDRIPLMARWVWDARVGTGVLREVWHAEDVDAARITAPDDLATFATLRAELDAYYAKLYGLTRDELRYILDPTDVMGQDYPSETFRVLKKKEQGEFDEYRTQRLVLAAWDKLERGELR